MKIFKIQAGGRPSFKKIVFGDNSAGDCPILVNFSVGKQFFTEFRKWDRYQHSTKRIFHFSNAVWASSGGFGIVSDTLVIRLLCQST